MDTVHVQCDMTPLTFDAAKRAADALARVFVDDPVCLSWYDSAEDRESPAHASECHDASCEIPGYIEYAVSRGAVLKVDVDRGGFVFCYRPLGEFADSD
jgi:hypothetical protein